MKALSVLLIVGMLVGCQSQAQAISGYNSNYHEWSDAVHEFCYKRAAQMMVAGYKAGLTPDEAALFSRNEYLQCMYSNGLVI